MAERDQHTDATNGPGGDDTPPEGDDYAPEQEGHDVSRWTFGRVVGYTLGGLIALVVMVVLAVTLLLQTPWGAEQAKKRVMVPLVNNALQEGAELEVDRVGGSFITNLRFYDAAIVDSTGRRLLVTDTASVDFNLLGLLRGRLAINEAALSDPAVAMHQRADGTWDLLDILIAPQDTLGPRLNLHLDHFATSNGYLEMHFYPPSSDSVLVADNLDVRFSELRVGERINVRLDTLTGRYIFPGTTDSVYVAAAGQLADDEMTVGHLRLNSPHSFVRTGGTLLLPGEEEDYVRDIDFELHADPLAFRDIHPFFPTLNREAVVTLDAQLGGTTRALRIDAEGTTVDGATLAVDGTVTPGAEGPLTYQLDAQVQQLDPDYFTAGASEERMLINGEISVDLAGTELQALTGTFDASLSGSRIATLEVREADLEGTVEDGETDVSLRTLLQGGSFTAQAGGRFFDEVPSYRAEGQFSNVHLGELTNDPQQESDLTGSITLRGTGTDPETAEITADLRLRNSTLNGQSIERGTADLTLRDGTLRFDADFAIPGGSFAALGTARFREELVTYQIEEGRFENVNLAVFTGAPEQQSDLTGTFTAQGRGTSLEEMQLEARLDLAPSRYGTYRIRQAQAQLDLADERLTFDADARLRGGRFVMSGTYNMQGEVPSYRAEGTFSNVHLGELTDDPQRESDLTGSITLHGTGTDPETAEITASFRLRNSTLDGQAIERGTADLTLRGGNLRFDVDFGTPSGSFVARGTGTFRGGTARYRITEGRFENVNVAAFTGAPEQQSDLTGTFTAQGRGTSLEEIQLDATLDVAPSRYGTYDIQGVEAQLSLADERLTFDTDARLQGGRFDLSGTLNMQGQVPSYRAEGTFSNVHLGELTNDPQQESDLTGSITLRGTGTDPETAEITADLRLRNSTLNGQPIERGTADLTLRGGNLRFDADFATPGGSFAALGTARFRGDLVTYRIEEGSFENLNIATFTGDTTQTSRLTGTFTAQGRGTDLATLTLDAQVDLEESVFNRQEIRQATLTIGLERGQLDLIADVQTPEGGFRFRGGGDLLADQLTFALQEGTFRNVDVGAWINMPDFSTSLNGRVMFESAGTDLQAATVDAVIELDTSRINQALLVDGRLGVQLEGGALEASGRLDFADGRAVFDADALFTGDDPGGGLRRYTLQADLDRVDVGALTGVDTLDARATLEVNLSGRGTDPETMELQASVTGSEIAYQDTDVQHLRLQAAVSDGVVRVDTLVLRANFADVTAGGRIALWSPRVTSDFRFQADVQNLAPIRPFLDAQQFTVNDGYVEGRVYGTRNTLRITAGGRVSTLVYDDIRIAGFDGRVNVALDTLQQIERGDVRAEVNYLSVPAITIQQTELQARYDGDEVTFEGDVRVDARREAEFAGVVDLRPGRERLQIDELNLRFEDEQWELLQPATVAYAEEYRISGLLLYSDDQQIAIDGVIDPEGQQNLVLTVENVEIDPITDLLQYEGLGGTVTGSIDLTGPAAAPNLDGVLMADLRSFDEPVGTLRLGVDYDSLRLNLDALLTHRDGSTLSGEGYIVYDFSLAPREGAEQGVRLQTQQVSEGDVDFTARADSFAIGWVEPFLDPETVRRIDGRLTGEVLIGGTVDAPDLQGEARLLDGRVDLPQLGLAYTDIHAEAVFENDRIRLQRTRMRSGGGRLTAEGTVNVQNLTSASFDLRARATDFLAIDTRDIRAVTSADVRVTGTTSEPVIRGDVRVLSANYYLVEEAGGGDLQSVTLKEQDVQMLERYFGKRLAEADTTTFDFYEASTIELDVELERNTWVRARSNPELNIQLTGDVDFVKPPHEPEQVFGTIEVIESRSYIRQLGRRFDITSGMLRFNGDPSNPAIDAAAEYQVKSKSNTGSAQVTITLAIEGRLQNPDITLGSNPPMENVDIISYIATGQPAGRGLNFEGQGGLLGRGESLAITQVAGLVEGMAAENLGLDVVEIQHEGLNDITLTLGKYVTPRLYAAVRQPLSNLTQQSEQATGTGTEFTLEYELLEWLLGRATQRNNTLRLDLFWEYSY